MFFFIHRNFRFGRDPKNNQSSMGFPSFFDFEKPLNSLTDPQQNIGFQIRYQWGFTPPEVNNRLVSKNKIRI